MRLCRGLRRRALCSGISTRTGCLRAKRDAEPPASAAQWNRAPSAGCRRAEGRCARLHARLERRQSCRAHTGARDLTIARRQGRNAFGKGLGDSAATVTGDHGRPAENERSVNQPLLRPGGAGRVKNLGRHPANVEVISPRELTLIKLMMVASGGQ